jgi:hypothetical protein
LVLEELVHLVTLLLVLRVVIVFFHPLLAQVVVVVVVAIRVKAQVAALVVALHKMLLLILEELELLDREIMEDVATKVKVAAVAVVKAVQELGHMTPEVQEG